MSATMVLVTEVPMLAPMMMGMAARTVSTGGVEKRKLVRVSKFRKAAWPCSRCGPRQADLIQAGK